MPSATARTLVSLLLSVAWGNALACATAASPDSAGQENRPASRSSTPGPTAQASESEVLAEAERLEEAARRLRREGDLAAAVRRAERALAIREEALGPEDRRTATSLNNLALLYHEMGEYGRAEPLYQRALAIYEVVLGPDRPSTATTVSNVAALYHEMGEYERAEPLYQRALRIREGTLGPEDPRTARSRNALASLYRAMGQYARAEPLLERTLTIREDALGPRHPDTATSLVEVAQVHRETGDYERAEALLQRALAIREDVLGPEHQRTVVTLGHLVVLYHATAEYGRAKRLAKRALSIYEAVFGPVHPNTAASLNNLGTLYAETGEYGRAEHLLQRALAIREKVWGPRHPHTAESLNNLASLYFDLGDYDRAEPLLRRALAIEEDLYGGRHPKTAETLNNLAANYSAMGEPGRAEPLSRRALAIAEEVLGPGHPTTTTFAVNLAWHYRSVGEFDAAEALLERALETRRSALRGLHPHLTILLVGLGELARVQGDPERARQRTLSAVWRAEASRDANLRWRVFGELAATEAALGHREAAIYWGKRAVNELQAARGASASLEEGLQRSFLESKRTYYEDLIELLLEAGRLPEAWQVMAMLKEQEYFDFIRRRAGEDDPRKAESSLTPEEASVAERQAAAREASGLAKLAEREEDLLRDKRFRPSQWDEAKEAELAAVREELAGAQAAFRARLETILADLRAEAREEDVGRRQLALAETFRDTLDRLRDAEDVVLLHYLVADEALHVILTTPALQRAFAVDVTREEVHRLVDGARRVLENPAADPRPALGALHARLFPAGLRKELRALGAETLLVSLDGTLRYVPLAALWNTERERFLVEDYTPVLYVEAARDRLQWRTQPDWAAAGLGLTRAVEGFRALPSVEGELEGIIRRRGAEGDDDGVLPGVVQLDEAFTRAELASLLELEYPVVHLASHFVFRPGNDRDSYLVLGDGSRLSLAAMDAMDLRFRGVDQLTLSACETAMGSGAAGAEVEGFGALALRKGAAAVVATLWRVADASTAELMRRFYAGKVEAGRSKGEALRQAQLALLRGEAVSGRRGEPSRGDWSLEGGGESVRPAPPELAGTRHPYSWAPFVLIGNWR